MPRKYLRKACRNCKAIVEPNMNQCPVCGSRDLSEVYSGFIIVINQEKSEIAKRKNIKEGFWAIKVF